MTGWFEAGAITERARALVRGLGEAAALAAEGAVAGRGPPGTGAAWRGAEAAELGVGGVRAALPQSPGARAGTGAVPARRAGPGAERLRLSGGSRGGQRPAGTRTAGSAAASAPLGSSRRRPGAALGCLRRRSGVAERERKQPKALGAARRSVALRSRSRPGCAWVCVCVRRGAGSGPPVRLLSSLSGRPGYFCTESVAGVASSQGTKPSSPPEAALFPERCGSGRSRCGSGRSRCGEAPLQPTAFPTDVGVPDFCKGSEPPLPWLERGFSPPTVWFGAGVGCIWLALVCVRKVDQGRCCCRWTPINYLTSSNCCCRSLLEWRAMAFGGRERL